MIQPAVLHIPFGPSDVQKIVNQEADNKGSTVIIKGSADLKERVIRSVTEAMGLETGAEFPERVRSWVHKLCLVYTAGLSVPQFTWKLAEPIDLSSLPESKFHGKKVA